MKGGTERFPPTTGFQDGHRVTYRTIRCCRCPKHDRINDNTPGGLPPSPVAAKFRQRGWHVASRANGDMCPACAPGRAQRRAAFLRKAGIPKATPKPQPETAVHTDLTKAPPGAKAPAPRQPAPADRRRVLDALEAAYDTDAQRYLGVFTDDAVAKSLDVPRAWVSELREMMFGPEINEAAVKRDADILALEGKVKTLEGQASDMLNRFAEGVAGLAAEVARLKR